MLTLFKEFTVVLTKFSGQSDFKKNLLVLMGGTAIAQLIPIIASPVLSRIFTPIEFGFFANFMAISAFITVYVSGKYELALILPKEDKDAINILSLSLLLAAANTVLLVLFFYIFSTFIADMLNVNNISNVIWLIPISSFISVLYLIFNEWCIRKKSYFTLSKNKISNTAGITGVSMAAGFSNISTGLIIGQVFGQLLSMIMAFYRVISADKGLLKYISASKMKYFMKKHGDFPKFNIAGQLLNTFSGQLPILVMSSKFGPDIVGYFAMTDRVLGMPLTYLGNSFRDVFKKSASDDYKEKGNCMEIYKKTTFTLIKIAIIPFIVLFITAPFIFSLVFGSNWETSGDFARILCLLYLISFISMPTSWLFVIAEKQKLDFLWQFIFFGLTTVSILIGYFFDDITIFLVSFCASRCVAYLIQIYFTYTLAKGKGFYVA